jgi:predicted metal-binding protein
MQSGNKRLADLVGLARTLGADGAVLIPTAKIVVEERLADLCRAPGCQNYGLSASCPPHVGGPAAFRGLLNALRHSVFFKLDVATAILLSDERWPLYRRLHRIGGHLRQASVDRGFGNTRAFAGGSCRSIFCREHPDCRVVDRHRACRHPTVALPSMSGYGVNVMRLMACAGWSMNPITRDTAPETIPTGSVSGLVLVG